MISRRKLGLVLVGAGLTLGAGVSAAQGAVLITAPKNDLATATALLEPAKGQFVFARAHAVATGQRKLRITVTPDAKGRRLVAHHRHRVTLRLRITYTPKGGRRAYIVGHYVEHLPGPSG
jgi:hypothetical protein